MKLHGSCVGREHNARISLAENCLSRRQDRHHRGILYCHKQGIGHPAIACSHGINQLENARPGWGEKASRRNAIPRPHPAGRLPGQNGVEVVAERKIIPGKHCRHRGVHLKSLGFTGGAAEVGHRHCHGVVARPEKDGPCRKGNAGGGRHAAAKGPVVAGNGVAIVEIADHRHVIPEAAGVGNVAQRDDRRPCNVHGVVGEGGSADVRHIQPDHIQPRVAEVEARLKIVVVGAVEIGKPAAKHVPEVGGIGLGIGQIRHIHGQRGAAKGGRCHKLRHRGLQDPDGPAHGVGIVAGGKGGHQPDGEHPRVSKAVRNGSHQWTGPEVWRAIAPDPGVLDGRVQGAGFCVGEGYQRVFAGQAGGGDLGPRQWFHIHRRLVVVGGTAVFHCQANGFLKIALQVQDRVTDLLIGVVVGVKFRCSVKNCVDIAVAPVPDIPLNDLIGRIGSVIHLNRLPLADVDASDDVHVGVQVVAVKIDWCGKGAGAGRAVVAHGEEVGAVVGVGKCLESRRRYHRCAGAEIPGVGPGSPADLKAFCYLLRPHARHAGLEILGAARVIHKQSRSCLHIHHLRTAHLTGISRGVNAAEGEGHGGGVTHPQCLKLAGNGISAAPCCPDGNGPLVAQRRGVLGREGHSRVGAGVWVADEKCSVQAVAKGLRQGRKASQQGPQGEKASGKKGFHGRSSGGSGRR